MYDTTLLDDLDTDSTKHGDEEAAALAVKTDDDDHNLDANVAADDDTDDDGLLDGEENDRPLRKVGLRR